MSSDRFHGAIEGPLGGMAFKGGTSLTFSLHHDRAPLLLEIAAEAKEGTPWLTIRASEWEPGAAKRLIFDGPLAALTEWPLGHAPVELLVASPSTQPPPVHILLRSSSVLCGAQGDTTSNDLGNVTCDACLAIYDEIGGCGDPSCPGWCIMNAQPPLTLGEVQACIDCGRFTDEEAIELARASGCSVRDTGTVRRLSRKLQSALAD